MPSKNDPAKAHNRLNRKIVNCTDCPRLIEHCSKVAVEKRAAYRDFEYHGKPVPNFGDPKARLLIVGLAPGAHGANRTGRMFTGDRSGDFLYDVMHEAGYATQPESIDVKDGLKLKDAMITAAAHCAPPGNKPTTEELVTCQPFLEQTIDMLPRLSVILSLGKIAHDAVLKVYRNRGIVKRLSDFRFAHAAAFEHEQMPTLLCAYHPSQQNTFTGRLTREMLIDVFLQAKQLSSM